MDALQEKIVDSLKVKAINALNNKNYKDAFDTLIKVLELQPDNEEFFLLKGNALMGLKKYEEAIKSYSLAIEYKTDFEKAFLKRAIAKREIGDILSAQSDFNIVLKINPNNFECLSEIEKTNEREVLNRIQEVENNIFGEFIDSRDNQKYKTVKIGEQTWMIDFLRYDTTKKTLFGKKSYGNWIYDDKISNLEMFGRLYSWEVVESALPDGWRIPGVKDIEMLICNISGYVEAEIPLNSRGFYSGRIPEIKKKGSYETISRSTIFNKINKDYNLLNVLAGYRKNEKDRPTTWDRYNDIEETAFVWLISGLLNYTRGDLYLDNNFYKCKEEMGCSILCIKQ